MSVAAGFGSNPTEPVAGTWAATPVPVSTAGAAASAPGAALAPPADTPSESSPVDTRATTLSPVASAAATRNAETCTCASALVFLPTLDAEIGSLESVIPRCRFACERFDARTPSRLRVDSVIT